jgi:hypothetical protein
MRSLLRLLTTNGDISGLGLFLAGELVVVLIILAIGAA